ncbi:hypothetical protein MPDQ_005567 [Monascus purpureus]|uniref:Monooxygenase n=1 Tax=Monascus purpureus TaxID=5098 RepID=A0A507R2X7_MONPU|nr:hypothetical protein MPDQ_005567 [Monascus purpureus]
MAPLKPLVQPTDTRPSTAPSNAPLYAIIFDNFQKSTWFLIAASLQGLLTWLFPTVLTFLPALFILAYRALDPVLIMYGLRPNPYMKDVIPGKISAQVPDETGQFGEQPSRKTVVVLLLGSRSNHPLGILYPEYQKIEKFISEMMQDLETNREEYTFLTSSSWISNSDSIRNVARETMTVFYFQSLEGLHRFSHGPSHRAGWDWWNQTVKEHPNLSIMHEVYEAPAGSWENVYMNYWPTSFAKAQFPINRGDVEKETDGQQKKWIGNIVDASRMNMKSSMNRLGRR